MTRHLAATGTVKDGTVKVRFGSCRGHSQQGLSARADGIDGLCAVCRALAAAEVRKFNTYNGSKPLAEEVTPPASIAGNTKRMNGRQERKQEFAEELKAALAKMPLSKTRWANAVQEAGRQVEIAPKTARDYGRELKAADPVFWAEAEAAQP